jgi:hypothetical protein
MGCSPRLMRSRLRSACIWKQQGPDVMILEIVSPKKLAKKLAFFVQTNASFF